MRQHYIPEFILKGFVEEGAPGNRGIWVFDAKRQRWNKRPTRRTASIDDFYSFVESGGERDDQLEDFLQSLETPVAMLLARDIAAKRPLGAPHPEDLFVTFCAFLIVRNPLTIDQVKKDLAQRARDFLEEITASPEAFQHFRAEVAAGTGQEFPNLIDFRRLRTDFAVNTRKAGGLSVSLGMSIALRETRRNVGRFHVRALARSQLHHGRYPVHGYLLGVRARDV